MITTDWGPWALLPLAITLILAFATRSALVAMLLGTVTGTLMLGQAPGAGLNELFQAALGNGDFIWICQIVLLIGILFQLFRRAGVLGALAQRFSRAEGSRRSVEVSAWTMGLIIIDDYFSPLLSGSVLRPMSDRARIPREKLAFILDSTTASVCILVPFTAWGAYVASLIAAQGGPVTSIEQGVSVFIAAIPYNFYPLLMLLFTLLICLRVIPDFGPMQKAEQRVRETGELLRPGAKPLSGDEGDDVTASDRRKPPSLTFELLVPVLLLVGVGAATLIIGGSVKIVEAFMLVNVYLFAVLGVRGEFASVAELGDVIVAGSKSIMPALLIVALAYALNAVTSELNAAGYIIAQFASDLTPNTLVALTFGMAAVISFSTGTSWGAYALMMPVALPVAFEFSGGELTPLVYQTVAAVAGGGIFGDHSSPVSDTSVLASVGAGSDHIDHVVTQLPYAVLVAVVTTGLYLLI
ncbi:MAG: Na+/H+ antiporter NhaC family protein [Woeseiaceae bacterium]|nr:Na+/H+ antiporter NhaC family protein [Woeseiaceae bacterium]